MWITLGQYREEYEYFHLANTLIGSRSVRQNLKITNNRTDRAGGFSPESAECFVGSGGSTAEGASRWLKTLLVRFRRTDIGSSERDGSSRRDKTSPVGLDMPSRRTKHVMQGAAL